MFFSGVYLFLRGPGHYELFYAAQFQLVFLKTKNMFNFYISVIFLFCDVSLITPELGARIGTWWDRTIIFKDRLDPGSNFIAKLEGAGKYNNMLCFVTFIFLGSGIVCGYKRSDRFVWVDCVGL